MGRDNRSSFNSSSMNLNGRRSRRHILLGWKTSRSRHQPRGLPHGVEAHRGLRLLTARRPSKIVSLPLCQNKRRSARGDQSSSNNRAKHTSRLTPFSSRQSSKRRWHDPTCKFDLLHEWPPSKVTHYSYKTAKTITQTHVRHRLGTYHPRQQEDHLPTEETKWTAHPMRPTAASRLLYRPSS